MDSVTGSRPENQYLDAALSYAARGMRVLPLHTVVDGKCTCDFADCDSPGKHPLTRNGVQDSTVNEATIRAWWTEAPIANVGVMTGPESGVWTLDADGRAGVEALARLVQENGPLPPGPRSRTGGGGCHLLFSYPLAGKKIKNAANVNGLPIDVRGASGYIVAPPSRHAS